MTGIYVHFPFCGKKCSYCSFYSLPYSRDEVKKYFDALHREIAERARTVKDSVDTLYIGGGTPSLMTDGELQSLIGDIRSKFKLSKNVEITVEANPESLTEQKLYQMIDSCVNRLSLGIQSLDLDARKTLGRNCLMEKKELLRQIAYVKESGINLSLDVIAGIPGRSIASVQSELAELCAFEPDHFSVYMLSVEKGTPLAKRFTPDYKFETMQRDVFSVVMTALKSRGYEQYEISNYARNKKYSNHNLKYWRFEDYIGFGPGAHSFVKGVRSYNESDLKKYSAGETVVHIDERSESQAIAEFIMTGMRLLKGMREIRFKSVFRSDFPEKVITAAGKLAAEGHLVIEGAPGNRNIRMTDEGIFYLDSILLDLTESLL